MFVAVKRERRESKKRPGGSGRQPRRPNGRAARHAARGGKPRVESAALARKASGQYHHGNLRRALLDAAVVLLHEKGLEAFTLREAARRLGVDHRAAYRHFEDRDALLAAVASESYDLAAAMAEAEHARAPEDPAARLLALARGTIRFAILEPARYRLMTGPRLNESGRFPELERALERAYGMVGRELRAGIASGVFRSLDVVEATTAFFAAVHGLASLILLRRIRVRPAHAIDFCERAIGHTLRGFYRAT